MNTAILEGVGLGIIIGTVFAWVQLQALRRNELLAQQQKLPASLRLLPGSAARVAFLLVALVLVQNLCPHADKWWLTGSLLLTVAAPTVWRLARGRASAAGCTP